MDYEKFFSSCSVVGELHFPRWNELPEFDLYMDQVIGLAEKYLCALSPDKKELITPSMINNYVKSGVLPPPKNKKYGRHQLALLLMICSTKSVLEISTVADIIGQSIESSDIQRVFDHFAEMYEKALCSAVERAQEMVREKSEENILSDIAMENALNAGAARTVAMYAYSAIATEEKAQAQNEEARSEKKSKKAKKSAEDTEQ